MRRIVGKVINHNANNDIKTSAGPLQTGALHSASAEAAIHAMKKLYDAESTDAGLLIDANNELNRMNRRFSLLNVPIICPTISNYLKKTYRHPSRSFLSGGNEILSMERHRKCACYAIVFFEYSINNSTTENSNPGCSASMKNICTARMV